MTSETDALQLHEVLAELPGAHVGQDGIVGPFEFFDIEGQWHTLTLRGLETLVGRLRYLEQSLFETLGRLANSGTPALDFAAMRWLSRASKMHGAHLQMLDEVRPTPRPDLLDAHEEPWWAMGGTLVARLSRIEDTRHAEVADAVGHILYPWLEDHYFALIRTERTTLSGENLRGVIEHFHRDLGQMRLRWSADSP